MLQFIMFAGPGCAVTWLYSILDNREKQFSQLFITVLGLSGIANLLTFLALYLVGYQKVTWTLEANLSRLPFCFKYMGTSFVFACLTIIMVVGFETIVKAVRKK